MVDYKEILKFYSGKNVLVTGNTGFKGSWLTYILLQAGAKVTGYALEPSDDPSLYRIIGLDSDSRLNQVYGDIRNLGLLKDCFSKVQPEIVIHLAAQPIVRESYRDPVNTYSTNVMGTVNICEAIRQTPSVRSFLNVTTDKVYKNREWEYGYRECDELDGQDPYSNSKSCSELVTHSYNEAFFKNCVGEDGHPLVRVSTARAGNVIGGGDFSTDRIIPDCIRALQNDGLIRVRNPHSTRPYQHVLEPLFAYLLIVAKQYEDVSYSGYYNVGPDDVDCVMTEKLTDLFCVRWNHNTLQAARSGILEKQILWSKMPVVDAPHESNFLKLDCSKLKKTFSWHPRWHIEQAVEETINWTSVWLDGGGARLIKEEMLREIKKFLEK